MSASTRTVVCDENSIDRPLLKSGGLNYNIAKSVASGSGPATYNLIWQSQQQYAPSITVAWQVNYALNWAVTLPTTTAAVSFAGDWQPCESGESYDLNEVGTWVQSAAVKNPNALNVGKNNYSSSVYIIIGVETAPGIYGAIWVDQQALLVGNYGEYTPVETAKVWWQSSTVSGTMMSTQGSAVQEINLTIRNPVTLTFLKYCHYDATTGAWDQYQNTPFSPTTSNKQNKGQYHHAGKHSEHKEGVGA